ncbi:MAG: nuclear transport factor 2 family protein [Pseudomonadota bacterium]
MTSNDMIDLVERYFRAVDAEDLDGVLATLSPDCVFTVETHGVHMRGPREISEMFRRLWRTHRAVKHHRFTHVADSAQGRIASRFTVENTELDGSLTRKSNCNFFEIGRGPPGRFTAVAVYMAGPNTLDPTGEGAVR